MKPSPSAPINRNQEKLIFTLANLICIFTRIEITVHSKLSKMKTFKKTIIVFLAVLLLLGAAAYLLPEQVHVERSLLIDAPARIVFSQVNDLQCWGKWATWNQIDPEMKIEYINGGIGQNAGYEWTSENKQVGNGKMYITFSLPYDSIAVSMDFMEGGLATGYFLFKEDSSKTNVTWAFDTHLGKNPMARWVGLMFDKMMGPDFEKSLNNLQTLCSTIISEQQAVVEPVILPESVFAGIKKNVKWENIGVEMGNMYQQISAFIQQNNLTIADMPLAIYHSMNEDNMEIECGIPVTEPFESKAGINCGKRAAGKYAYAIHVGSYETLEQTHTTIQKWISDHGFTISGGPVEVYLTDPQSEPNPEKWVTNIYYPL